MEDSLKARLSNAFRGKEGALNRTNNSGQGVIQCSPFITQLVITPWVKVPKS